MNFAKHLVAHIYFVKQFIFLTLLLTSFKMMQHTCVLSTSLVLIKISQNWYK